MKSTIYTLFLALSVLTIYSCKGDPAPATTTTSTEKKKTVKVPTFNADSAYTYVEQQLAFGYRVPGTDDHKACGQWLMDKLESYGGKVYKQDFKSNFQGKTNVPSFNIIAQYNPEHTNRIAIAAHWDSRIIAEKDDERKDQPIPGADDGASGVAVALEIARIISENPIDMGVDIILFDAEDQGDNESNESWAQGAQYWASNLVPKGYSPEYGILLDMVGSEGAVFGREEFSYVNAREYQDRIWDLAQRMGYSDFFRSETSGAVMDDHYWVMKNTNGKIRMIDIINQSADDRSSFGAYHHTHDDDIDIISKRTLRVVGQVVTAALYNESIGVI